MPRRTSPLKKTTTPPRARVRPSRSTPIIPPPPIVSVDEKRQLILAHAANRRSLDPLQRVSLWAGVSICALFIAVAWFYTVGLNMKKAMGNPLDSGFQGVAGIAQDFKDTAFQEKGTDIKNLEQRLDDVSRSLAEKSDQQFVNSMVTHVSSSLATTSSSALFRPQPSSTSTTKITSSTAL